MVHLFTPGSTTPGHRASSERLVSTPCSCDEAARERSTCKGLSLPCRQARRARRTLYSSHLLLMLRFLRRLMSSAPSLSAATFLTQRKDRDPVLDVRTPKEYGEGHLEGAINVDVKADDFQKRIEELDLPKDQRVYLYCRSGGRSGKATGILREMGYQEAYNVGGFDDLAAAGADTEL